MWEREKFHSQNC
uniref:Uncharacterized protein n=1 Tax=Rhizophora mucronata TaxID=61149 RepID=A0A2P2PEU3_RHIMU